MRLPGQLWGEVTFPGPHGLVSSNGKFKIPRFQSKLSSPATPHPFPRFPSQEASRALRLTGRGAPGRPGPAPCGHRDDASGRAAGWPQPGSRLAGEREREAPEQHGDEGPEPSAQRAAQPGHLSLGPAQPGHPWLSPAERDGGTGRSSGLHPPLPTAARSEAEHGGAAPRLTGSPARPGSGPEGCPGEPQPPAPQGNASQGPGDRRVCHPRQCGAGAAHPLGQRPLLGASGPSAQPGVRCARRVPSRNGPGGLPKVRERKSLLFCFFGFIFFRYCLFFSPRLCQARTLPTGRSVPVPGKVRECGVRLPRARLPSEHRDSASPWEEAPGLKLKALMKLKPRRGNPPGALGAANPSLATFLLHKSRLSLKGELVSISLVKSSKSF